MFRRIGIHTVITTQIAEKDVNLSVFTTINMRMGYWIQFLAILINSMGLLFIINVDSHILNIFIYMYPLFTICLCNNWQDWLLDNQMKHIHL